MMRCIWFSLFLFVSATGFSNTKEMLLIQGASGAPDYEELFDKVSTQWISIAESVGMPLTFVGTDSESASPKDRIREWITSDHRNSAAQLWIVYVGHGTNNAAGAKLNLAGEDISHIELSNWLEPWENELIFVHGGSASAPFIPALSGANRVIVTATRSGTELNYARFGGYFARALADPKADLDLDGVPSLLEAFLSATNSVETYYRESGRLTSEHALLDDNGDSRGTQADQYDGLRLIASADPNGDGALSRNISLSANDLTLALSSEEIKKRNKLEADLETLRQRKEELSETDYYEQLESILSELSTIYIEEADS